MFDWLPWSRKRRRQSLLATAWPEAWSRHLNRNVRLTWNLTESQRQDLQSRIKIFVAEKTWEGCEGLVVTEEMKVTVAANACLMLLGVEDFYFDNVRTILMYPQVFSRRQDSGRTAGGVEHRSGEAWQGGPIVLSWRDVLRGGRDEADGRNVTIHEFAHALDGLDGEMGGNIAFDSDDDSTQWKRVVDSEYAQLVDATEQNRPTLLDHYGATNQAEFFAVATEAFFERPAELEREHAQLFSLLQKYYRINPIPWQRSARD